jgi:hypothetical protein
MSRPTQIRNRWKKLIDQKNAYKPSNKDRDKLRKTHITKKLKELENLVEPVRTKDEHACKTFLLQRDQTAVEMRNYCRSLSHIDDKTYLRHAKRLTLAVMKLKLAELDNDDGFDPLCEPEDGDLKDLDKLLEGSDEHEVEDVPDEDGESVEPPEEDLHEKTLSARKKQLAQSAFPPGFSEKLAKKTHRVLGGTGKVFTPVLDWLRKVEEDATPENLAELESAATTYLQHAKEDLSKLQQNDPINRLKQLTAEKILRDIERLRTETQQLKARRHEDPLRADPVLAKLLDQKHQVEQELLKLHNQPEVPESDLRRKARHLRKIEESIVTAQKHLNEHGFVPKHLGDEYDREDQQRGWRTGNIPTPPIRQQDETDDDFALKLHDYEAELARWQEMASWEDQVVHYLTPEERQEYELTVDDQGKLRDHAGQLVSGELDYVIAPDGKMYRKPEGIVNTGKKVLDPKTGEMIDQVGKHHHSSVLGGGEVVGAGDAKVEQGLLRVITNVSGHYKPGAVQMIQTVEQLFKQGALLDKEWVDAKGRSLTGAALKLYTATLTAQRRLMELLVDYPNANVKYKLERIKHAKQMLSKLGCGPSNRPTPTLVEFIEITEGMTGQQILDQAFVGENKVFSTQEFLQTGGGNQQQSKAKESMLDELLYKMRHRKQELDEQAIVGKGGKGPSIRELEQMRDNLVSDQEHSFSPEDGEDEQFEQWLAKAAITNTPSLRKHLGPDLVKLLGDKDRDGAIFLPEPLAKRLKITTRSLYEKLKGTKLFTVPEKPNGSSKFAKIKHDYARLKDAPGSPEIQYSLWLDGEIRLTETFVKRLTKSGLDLKPLSGEFWYKYGSLGGDQPPRDQGPPVLSTKRVAELLKIDPEQLYEILEQTKAPSK